MAKRGIKGLYVKHPIHGRIPNWKQVWRCRCCTNIYRAILLTPVLIDELQAADYDMLPYPHRAMAIPYACCPTCHAFQVAEFGCS